MSITMCPNRSILRLDPFYTDERIGFVYFDHCYVMDDFGNAIQVNWHFDFDYFQQH